MLLVYFKKGIDKSCLLLKSLNYRRGTIFHGIYGHPHSSIADHIQGQIVGLLLEIKDSVPGSYLSQVLDEFARVLVHHLVEVLQDVEVECGCDHFAVLVPFAASTGEQTQSQPRMG